MTEAFICDAVRTPIGRYGGALAGIRADNLGAVPMKALLARNPQLDPGVVDEVFYGCANQSGEDNRNVARMAALAADWVTLSTSAARVICSRSATQTKMRSCSRVMSISYSDY